MWTLFAIELMVLVDGPSGRYVALNSFYRKGGDLVKKLSVRRLEPVKTSVAILAEDCPAAR
jgi:hypothetical protein